MIIGLAGLHGSGKSFFCGRCAKILPAGVLDKRNELKLLHAVSGVQDDNWERWYRNEYKRVGPYQLMRHILENFRHSTCTFTIIDAIHNLQEWRAVKDVDASALLVGVFAPISVRLPRNIGDRPERDQRRVAYWHERADVQRMCLMAEIEWAFTGCCGVDQLDAQCVQLREFLHNGR